MSRESYGEGSIYEHKDGHFSGYIVMENHKRKYFYGKTKREVLEKIKRAQREQEKLQVATGPKQTVKQFFEYWLENIHKPKMKLSSYVKYRQIVDKHIVPELGNIQMQKLTSDYLEKYYSKLLKDGLSPKRIRDINGVVHAGLQYAVRKKRLAKNVCDGVDLPRVSRHVIQPLNKSQAQKLMEAAKGHHLETLIVLALVTGMRRGELLALRWSDIDFEAMSIHVQRTVDRLRGYGYKESEPKTKRSRRNVVIPQFVVDRVILHRQQQEEIRLGMEPLWEDHDLVFCNLHGRFLDPDRVAESFKKIVSQAELPKMRFHDLRHSAATILLTMGAHPKVVQELLGHSQISMTMDTYSHVLPSMHRIAMDGWNDVLGDDKG